MPSITKKTYGNGVTASFTVPMDANVSAVTVSGSGATYTVTPGLVTISPVPAAAAPVVLTYESYANEVSSVDTMSVLDETIFSDMDVATLASGDHTLDGRTWTSSVAAGGAVAIVAAGLQLKSGTAAESTLALKVGSTGLSSILSQDQWRRGRFGFWFRTASYNFASTTAGYFYGTPSAQYPSHGGFAGRARNTLGAANTNAGSQITATWWAGAQQVQVTTTDTDDVYLMYFRTPMEFEVYSGTWAGAWPQMSAMTMRMQGRLGTVPASSTSWKDLALWTPMFLAGTNDVDTEVIIDRCRWTVWR